MPTPAHLLYQRTKPTKKTRTSLRCEHLPISPHHNDPHIHQIQEPLFQSAKELWLRSAQPYSRTVHRFTQLWNKAQFIFFYRQNQDAPLVGFAFVTLNNKTEQCTVTHVTANKDYQTEAIAQSLIETVLNFSLTRKDVVTVTAIGPAGFRSLYVDSLGFEAVREVRG